MSTLGGEGVLFGTSKAAFFILLYDSNNRIGVYAYFKEQNKIETILPASRVVVGPHVDNQNYYLFLDNDSIKISSAAQAMTFHVYIIRRE